MEIQKIIRPHMQVFHKDELDLMPVGTTFTSLSWRGDAIVKREDGYFTELVGHRYSPSPAEDPLFLKEYPDPEWNKFDYKQFLWSFYDAAMASAERNGTRDSVVEVMESLKLGVKELGLYTGLRVWQMNGFRPSHQASIIPPGTLFSEGLPGSPNYRLFRLTPAYSTEQILGPSVDGHYFPTTGVTIESVGGVAIPAPWLEDDPTDEDQLQTKRFIVNIWRIGRNAKDRYSWCGAYESTMDSIGLTGEVVRRLSRELTTTNGVDVDRETMLRAENGTLFKCGTDYYMKRESSWRLCPVAFLTTAGRPSTRNDTDRAPRLGRTCLNDGVLVLPARQAEWFLDAMLPDYRAVVHQSGAYVGTFTGGGNVNQVVRLPSSDAEVSIRVEVNS